ncbi:MAG: multiheme c-type cytochrome [Acidobacteriota bacterium]
MKNCSLKAIIGLVYLWVACLFLLFSNQLAEANPDGELSDDSPAVQKLFSPSNGRTADGQLIPVEQFFPASRCLSCHADTHKAWAESLHRNAAREPFYRRSADILLATRGIEFTRHCESCHTPVALFSGALTKANQQPQAPFTALDDEGVTCSVCHAITEARLDGTGSFTLRRPALLAKEDGTPVYDKVTDEQILADVAAHKRAVMRPLLKQPEFCAACHKVDAPPTLNGYKHIRGFSAYDEWQQSGASHESITPFYRREKRTDCRACHMPKVDSTNDRAAKRGMIASHRWLGANTVVPLFYDQREQADLTRKFLETQVVDVDIFAVRNEATRETVAPLNDQSSLAVKPGDELTVEVVIANRNAAHSFPPEVRDLYEAWVEFAAFDSQGTRVFHSGFIQPDGTLDERAHVYKTILLDEAGRHITRHQIWLTNIKAYDNAIQAGRSDVVRFRFPIPETAIGNIKFRAKLNYRRFNQEYANYILNLQRRVLPLPVVQMRESESLVTFNAKPFNNRKTQSQQSASDAETGKIKARRWNDYGIGLLEQAQYGAAAEAFRRAAQCDTRDANLLVNAAIAEMRTERFGIEREQLRKAAELLELALQLAPDNLRARLYHALVLRGQGKIDDAADELASVAQSYPRDREVQRQRGQTLYTLGKLSAARAAFEAILNIDPTDAQAYQLLQPIYASEGLKAQAAGALNRYFQWRDDPRATTVAARFFTAHPEWTEERIATHLHGKTSTLRPVLTGQAASPDR